MRIFVFKKRTLYVVIGLIVALLIGIFALTQFTRDRTVSSIQLKYNYQKLLPEEANVFIHNNPELIIIDVRSKRDYDRGHLTNALYIPYRDLKDQLGELSPNDAYLVYCDNGKDSIKASKLMADSGFPRVFTLIGGYKKWPYEIRKVH